MRIIHIAEATLQALSQAHTKAESEVRLLRMENTQLLQQINEHDSLCSTMNAFGESLALKEAMIQQLKLDLDGEMVANCNLTNDLMEAEKWITDLLEKQRVGELRYNALMSKMDKGIVEIKNTLTILADPFWRKFLTTLKNILLGTTKKAQL